MWAGPVAGTAAAAANAARAERPMEHRHILVRQADFLAHRSLVVAGVATGIRGGLSEDGLDGTEQGSHVTIFRYLRRMPPGIRLASQALLELEWRNVAVAPVAQLDLKLSIGCPVVLPRCGGQVGELPTVIDEAQVVSASRAAVSQALRVAKKLKAQAFDVVCKMRMFPRQPMYCVDGGMSIDNSRSLHRCPLCVRQSIIRRLHPTLHQSARAESFPRALSGMWRPGIGGDEHQRPPRALAAKGCGGAPYGVGFGAPHSCKQARAQARSRTPLPGKTRTFSIAETRTFSVAIDTARSHTRRTPFRSLSHDLLDDSPIRVMDFPSDRTDGCPLAGLAAEYKSLTRRRE